ncbi:MAG: hypothetical protein R3315_13025, partial [Woeseiaceae bacterium]|nr:hypothetical protein [Woeseiaceae bacterium]
MTRLLFTFAMLVIVISMTAASAAQERGFADPLLGRWDLSVQGPDGVYPSWMEVRLRTERSLMAEFV